MKRKTKIIATLGPSSQEEAVLSRMIEAGMDVARLNFSHGNYEDHQEKILSIRKLSQKFRMPITILQDLQGPKMRVGELPGGGLDLVSGALVTLYSLDTGKDAYPELRIPLEVPSLYKNVQIGDRILLDDGKLELKVTNTGEDYLIARVMIGGILKSHKGIHFPGIEFDIDVLTEKDTRDLKFGIENGIDIVAISFVQKAKDVQSIRETIQRFSPNRRIPIISKIERPEAIRNLDEILEASDGIMVARGDLAVETSPEMVPVYQKQIIQAANLKSKIVITATQMLESMIDNPRPTRAEASDVANAVFDGSDAVMLSAESASGHYPVETIEMMTRIICQAELHFQEWGYYNKQENPTNDDAVSLTLAAKELAQDRNVSAIAIFTQTGRTAILMSKARPQVPILAFTPDENTYRRLNILWGVYPFLVPFSNTVETMLSNVDGALVSFTNVVKGDQVIIISGFPVGHSRPPNFILLHTIGSV